MALDNRKARRVEFLQGIEAEVRSIDGTWRIKCRVDDISATGAKLKIFSQIPTRMHKEEFFLILSKDAKVARHAKLSWSRKARIGLEFIGLNKANFAANA
jgi:c-di-GMP-binding flagellar brake protein YcgR